jgi:radical SAM superfamily enzyme YgiQ (UPF0313 family)
VALSSLGFQTLYRVLNDLPGVSCERATLDDPGSADALRTIETGRRVGEAHVLGLSVATEEEVALAARALMAAGLPPLERDRRGLGRGGPLVVAGGPLTYADPRPLCALADVVICGEAEDALCELVAMVAEESSAREGASASVHESLLERIAALPGAMVPAVTGEREVERAVAGRRWLPAFSAVTTPRAEFSDMFLIEPARGCPRRCAFCVMGSSDFRTVEPDEVIGRVPGRARRVGLVGSALCDHPRLSEIVERLVADGRSVSVSSLRADRLDAALLELLARGGMRSLTIAADGASERLRRLVRKHLTADDLLRAAELAAGAGLRAVKLYAMVGLPTETPDDVLELCALARDLAKVLPVSLAVSPFVPKAGTSLADAAFGPVPLLRRHLALVRRHAHVKHVAVRASSVRAAVIEHAVARGGLRAGLAAADVAAAGCTRAAWKDAIERQGLLD